MKSSMNLLPLRYYWFFFFFFSFLQAQQRAGAFSAPTSPSSTTTTTTRPKIIMRTSSSSSSGGGDDNNNDYSTSENTGIATTPTTTASISSNNPPFFSNHKHDNPQHQGNEKREPLIAVLTEMNTCESDERMNEIATALEDVATTGAVQLISIRLQPPPSERKEQERLYNQRVRKLCCRIQQFISNSKNSNRCAVVINGSSNLHLAVECGLDGIHIKEREIDHIPEIREKIQSLLQEQEQQQERRFLMGCSAHSIESAIKATKKYGVDYLFVGTCFLTSSHPEKETSDLEGPELPGTIQKLVNNNGDGDKKTIPCFAIGGIDSSNCIIPIQKGADGVAAIRSILQAKEPGKAAVSMHNRMKDAMNEKE